MQDAIDSERCVEKFGHVAKVQVVVADEIVSVGRQVKGQSGQE
jgi:hypothetical protein